MKITTTITTLALASASFAATSPNKGKNQAPHTGPCQIGIRTEYYELDHLTLHALVTTPTDQTDATGIRREILAKVALDEASLIQSSYVVTRSGQRAKVESVTEWIYPTEFDPPEVPQELGGQVSSTADIITPATPTAFETRNVGHTIEVDPVIAADGLTIDLNLAPELVIHLGHHSLGKAESQIEQPVFHTIKDSTSISLHTGTWAVLGIHNPPPNKAAGLPPTDRRVLSLVRTDIIDVGNAMTTEKSQGGQQSGPTNNDQANPFADPPTAEDLTAEQKKRALENEVPKQIAIHTEWVELDALTATKLLDQHAGGYTDANPLRAQLQKLITKKRATLKDSSYIVTRSGQRAKSESVKEWIYPTQMDPPEVPQKLTATIDPGATIKTHGAYTAFQTRNVGTTVEVDSVIGADNVTININIAPEIITLGGTSYSGQRESHSSQPIFYALKDSTAFSSHDGTSVLIGMHSPMPTDVTARNYSADKRILVVVTTRIIKTQ